MDLLSSQPFWPIQNGLIANFPPLESDLRCDVAVIGAGGSGALAAWNPARAGLDVVVLDARNVATGSTAGSTSLLQYEIDVPLHRLAERYGPARAEHAHHRCRYAIDALEKVVRRERLDCGFVRRTSLLPAAESGHVPMLRREFTARKTAGFDVAWWNRRQIRSHSRLPHHAGILSQDAAHVDIHRLTHGLLAAAAKLGARIFDQTTVTQTSLSSRGVHLHTHRGSRVRARHRVIATGYGADIMLPRRVTRWHGTYALITEPVQDIRDWPANECLIWDTGDPYLYLRTTDDHRVIIGGYDEPFRTAAGRDRKLPTKTAALHRRFKQLFPRTKIEVAYAWAGTFASTDDGLPFIGPHPRLPCTWFALGYAGNGITFSLLAAALTRDRILGRKNPDAEIFGFERL